MSPPQPRIGVAATFCSSNRFETSTQSSPRDATSSSSDHVAGRPHGREAFELAKRLVPTPLALGVGGVEVVVGKAQRDTRAHLSESARDEPVVDLDA